MVVILFVKGANVMMIIITMYVEDADMYIVIIAALNKKYLLSKKIISVYLSKLLTVIYRIDLIKQSFDSSGTIDTRLTYPIM